MEKDKIRQVVFVAYPDLVKTLPRAKIIYQLKLYRMMA